MTEVHDTHHPIAKSLYYDEQRREAKRRAGDFTQMRLRKFLRYLERVIGANPSKRGFLVGVSLTHVDLSVFQVCAGFCYAFPRSMAALAPACPRLVAVCEAVQRQERAAAYLASPRRIAFNQRGIFRHYPELDRPGAK